MLLNLLKAKIHRATVTQANLNYEGSITIDKTLLEASGLMAHEQVHVVNINNGERFITYVIEGMPGSGAICLNGAAARLVQPGDLVIIISYCDLTPEEAKTHLPKVVIVDEKNRLKEAYHLKPGTPIEAGAPLSREK
jgi:aspartate 1-decarboxylase